MCETAYYSAFRNEYDIYEKRSCYHHNRRCIDNTITGSNKCVGYCRYCGHPGFLTEKLRHQHNCIEKQCFYYVAKPEKKKVIPVTTDLSPAILPFVNNIIRRDDAVRVVRVENVAFKQYNAFYVTITSEFKFDEYVSQIENEFGIGIDFVKLDYDFDKCATLLCTF